MATFLGLQYAKRLTEGSYNELSIHHAKLLSCTCQHQPIVPPTVFHVLKLVMVGTVTKASAMAEGPIPGSSFGRRLTPQLQANHTNSTLAHRSTNSLIILAYEMLTY